MTDRTNQDKSHETARNLTEKALDAMVAGDDKKATELVEKAKKTDKPGVEEVLQDLNEDAGSDHSVPKGGR